MAKRTHSRTARTRAASTRSPKKTATRRSNESLTAWLGDLFGSEERAPRSSRSRSASSRAVSTSTRAGSKRRAAGTMSRSEAGRAGGLAPHRCRGRECTKRATRSSYR